jgi:protein ImuB
MPLAEALSLVHVRDAVTVEPMQPEADRTALEELALHCEQYSPCVGLEEAEYPHSLLLDISGIAHLFGGERLLSQRMHDDLAIQGFRAWIAVGDSVGSAWAAAHYLADAAKPVIIPSGQFDLLLDLPMEGLRLGESIAEKLRRLGIRTIRQVLGLKRSSLPARFGGEMILRLDQFLGKQPELITPCRPIAKFQIEHFLEDGTTQPEMIEPWWLMLLERLVGHLREKQLGTRHIQCTLITDRKTTQELTVRLCNAVADVRQIGDLLRLQFERLRLDAPLIGIRMEALETSHIEPSQQEMFVGRSQDHAHPLSLLLNRLSNRLGHHAVVRPRLLPHTIPEQAFEYVPVTENACLAATKCNNPTFLPLDRPTCLFSHPMPVEVIAVVPNGPPSVLFFNDRRFDIVDCRGPERIESGWWQGSYVRRDYYHMDTTEGHRFWLFRCLQNQRWFLHGGVF